MPLLSQLERLWLCEAIRLREEQKGTLDDAHINRLAKQHAQGFAERLEYRALALAERDGQRAALRHYRQGARLALWLLVLTALFSGASLSLAALGPEGRTLNIFWVLGSLLGLNLLSLGAWLLSFKLWKDHHAALGRLWLWLSEKLARDAKTAQLTPALFSLLERQNLLRWGIGSLTHGLWLLVSVASCLLLVAMLSARHYGFVWQTTLLQSADVLQLTQTLGALPELLGFRTPSAAAIAVSGHNAAEDPAIRHAWASWLVGVVLVYGVLPRAFLAILCYWRWRHGVKRLALDLNTPSYQLLKERLSPSSEPLGVVDAYSPVDLATRTLAAPQVYDGSLIVGVELDPNSPWLPASYSHWHSAGVIDSREQRTALLNQLSAQPVKELCIVCDARRSPDRGTLYLLKQLADNAEHCVIYFLASDSAHSRLAHWHEALSAQHLNYLIAPDQESPHA